MDINNDFFKVFKMKINTAIQCFTVFMTAFSRMIYL